MDGIKAYLNSEQFSISEWYVRSSRMCGHESLILLICNWIFKTAINNNVWSIQTIWPHQSTNSLASAITNQLLIKCIWCSFSSVPQSGMHMETNTFVWKCAEANYFRGKITNFYFESLVIGIRMRHAKRCCSSVC